MWNKQKLTKKSLKELAEIMPVLNEKEQKSCIGGTHFYNLSGLSLGSVGSGDDIRIISPEDLYTAKYKAEQKNDYSYKSSSSWGDSIQQSDISSDCVKNIVATITGESPDRLLITSGVIKEAATMTISGVSLIEIDRTSLSLRNAESLKSTMRHEKYHISNPSENIWISENGAYMDQTSDTSFKSLPLNYRKRIAETWEDEAKKYYNKFHSGAIPSGTIEAIRARCGI